MLTLLLVLAGLAVNHLVAEPTASRAVESPRLDDSLAVLGPPRGLTEIKDEPDLPGPTEVEWKPSPQPVATNSTAIVPTAQSLQGLRSYPSSGTAFVPDPTLAAAVRARIAGVSGHVGVAIKDVDSGRGVLIDPDREFQAASLFKLAVMYEVYKQRDLGMLPFDEVLVLTQRYADYDLGTLDRPVGSTISVGEALQRMITISDNSSAVLLTDTVGAANINRDIQALGLTHTHVLSDDLVTSPGDMLSLLEMLALGQGISPSTSAEMIQLLAQQRVNDRIPRLLPAGTVVAHKTGNLPGVANDVGIVYEPGATYIVALLVDGTSDEGEASQAEAQLARLAFDYFGTQQDRSEITGFPPAVPTSPHPIVTATNASPVRPSPTPPVSPPMATSLADMPTLVLSTSPFPADTLPASPLPALTATLPSAPTKAPPTAVALTPGVPAVQLAQHTNGLASSTATLAAALR